MSSLDEHSPPQLVPKPGTGNIQTQTLYTPPIQGVEQENIR